MRNKPEHDLSLMGAQRLGDWLRKQKALSPPVLEAVGTETLVRYCAGLLTAQEAEAVEGTLAADPIGRERWLQVHEILNALQQLSLDEIRTVSDGTDLRSQVAQMWLNTATAQAESLMSQPRWWERLQAAISEGEAATIEAFTLLSAVWHRWVTMMRVPAFALVRSGDRAQVLIAEGIPREIEVVVDRFEATREGCIHLRVALLQLDRSPALHLSGTPIAVAVNLGGEIVPLTRGEVSGGGRKPWRQKGTGRARQGSIRAPHWKGGGVVWGPHPRDYSQDMPKKMRRLALRCALSTKVAEQHLVVLDSLRLERPRTKDMVAILRNLGLAAKVLIALPEVDQNIVLSARNIPGVETLPARMLNIVDVLKHDYLVMPVAAVRQVEAWLAPERPAAAGALETGAPEEESA